MAEPIAVAGRTGLRADAEQNRDRILEVARVALELEEPVVMSAVARRAGVGQGTLYRHFPTREALVMAVHRADVADLVQAAPLLLQQEPPLQALRLWLDRLASYGRIKHGLAAALHGVARAELESEGYQPVLDAIDRLLEPNRVSGDVRRDLTAQELLLLVSFLWRIDLDRDWDSRQRRLLDLVMAGLRTG